jgi:hypothetical protein
MVTSKPTVENLSKEIEAALKKAKSSKSASK